MRGQAAIDCALHNARTLPMRGQAAIEWCCGVVPCLAPRRQCSAEHCGTTARPLRAQAATEMLVLAGFALAFMLPLAFLFISSSNAELSETSVNQAKISARTIADEAGELYLQGPDAKKTIFVNYPNGIVNGSIEGGLVVLTVNANGQEVDAVSTTFANISGNLAGKRLAGIQRIRLEYIWNGNYVNISYKD